MKLVGKIIALLLIVPVFVQALPNYVPRYVFGPRDNFDWEYYAEANDLSFNSEQQARTHYQAIGQHKNLSYCKKYGMAILLHLYNLSLADEFINKINHFKNINSENDYHVLINIPIASNIDAFSANVNVPELSIEEIRQFVVDHTPYHPQLVTLNNCKKLFQIYTYLHQEIELPKDRITIFFSENRGVDIGGFFLCMDQLKRNNIPFDFIVKIHSKKNPEWRERCTSFMNMHVNPILRKQPAIYACRVHPERHPNWCGDIKWIMDIVNVPNKNDRLHSKKYNFCGGTMFIVSRKLYDFFQQLDLIELFNKCNGGTYVGCSSHDLEHNYERLFGYVTEYLDLDVHYIPLDCC